MKVCLLYYSGCSSKRRFVFCFTVVVRQNEGRVFSFTTPLAKKNQLFYFNDLGFRVTERHFIVFEVQMCNGAQVKLQSSTIENSMQYDIYLGYFGRTGIWDYQGSVFGDVIILNPLDCSVSKTFWLDWNDGGFIEVGTGAVVGVDRILAYRTKDKIDVNFLGAYSSTALSGVWRVNIDESPVFHSPHYDNSTVIEVPEGTPAGSEVYTLMAFDAEGDAITYEMLDGQTHLFELTGDKLKILRVYDFEDSAQFFVLLFRANSTSYSIQASMGVRVTNVYDEKPLLMAVSVNVREELPVGTIIHGTHGLRDADVDDGFNFTLSGSDAAYFRVGLLTGQISIGKRMDFDADSSQIDFENLVLSVVDKGGNEDNVSLSIRLKETNDQPPSITSTFQLATVTGAVQQAGAIAHFNCSDKLEENTTSGYTIHIGHQMDGLFRLEGNEMFVDTTNITYDAVSDTDEAYTVPVICADVPHSGEVMSSTAIVLTEVTPDNSNDYVPVFVDLATVTVAENTAPNTVITTLQAVDKDAGDNGHITYQILSVTTDSGKNAQTTFKIDSENGELHMTMLLDVDGATGQRDEYVVVVLATDGGSPSRSTTGTMTVLVLDSDDRPAMFQKAVYFVEVTCSIQLEDILFEFSVQNTDKTFDKNITLSGDGSEYLSVKGLSVVLYSRPTQTTSLEIAITALLNMKVDSHAEDQAVLLLSFSQLCDEDTTPTTFTNTTVQDGPSTAAVGSDQREWAVRGIAVILCTALLVCIFIQIVKLYFNPMDMKVSPDKPSLSSRSERGRPSTPLYSCKTSN
ncbi:cadherin-23-like [Gigantopelta aegis]|uniref:cadherin-23-like n=1 Tax=Gigantopelta aegis TaxID=1735272 RepID=UPI001B88CD97|nr:cadherin-23-like [Gigantopelta aegis]